jgi:hypothetical protein
LKRCGTTQKRALDDIWGGWNQRFVYQVSSRFYV